MSNQALADSQQGAPGAARCPDEPTTQDIIASDKVAAPGWVRSESYEFLGDEDISKDRYINPDYAKQEFARLWSRTWQFACREEPVPEVGDYYVYDIGRHSFIVTRVAENRIKAYYNACLHRGTKLRASGSEGCASEFKCSFHGWSWNIDGIISSLGVISPHLRGQYTEQDILDQFTIGDSSVLGDVDRTLGEGETARQRMADMMREMFGKGTNTDLSAVSDSELLDCFSYPLFPNTFVFPGISLPLVYRFRPHPDDHRRSIYEVFFLRPVPLDGSRPDPAETVHLAEQQSLTEAEGMDPGFGAILDQDTVNLFMQQEGLEASGKPGITLGNYQEIRVRHFERAVDEYLGN